MKARLGSLFYMRPLERPHLELIKVCVEELDWVALGNGSVILVGRPYSDATDGGAVVLWENACTAKSTGKRKTY
jgi:hypothetical protein